MERGSTPTNRTKRSSNARPSTSTTSSNRPSKSISTTRSRNTPTARRSVQTSTPTSMVRRSAASTCWRSPRAMKRQQRARSMRALLPTKASRYGTPRSELHGVANMIAKQDDFEYWLADMDDALERFCAQLPEAVRAKLDYSQASLDVLEGWM